jgi:hypothetical protein
VYAAGSLHVIQYMKHASAASRIGFVFHCKLRTFSSGSNSGFKIKAVSGSRRVLGRLERRLYHFRADAALPVQY